MNTTDLQVKIDDIIKLLKVSMEESAAVEAKIKYLDESQILLSRREKSIYDREVSIKKREADIDAQKKYTEEQNRNAQLVLNKITTEKELLKGLVDEKRELEKEKSQVEIEKKGIEQMKKELEYLKYQKEQLEQERKLFTKEKEAIKEEHKLLAIREQNIIAKEQRQDKIERMTSL
jgi:uncharacterized protein (DUF3084 family)